MLIYNINILIALAVFGGFFFYGFIKLLISLRKRFPIKVNCWFCNTNLRVPYNDWNSFTCPSCCQYNGFDENGDYNKEISSQHYSKFNPNAYCQRIEQRLSPSNGFCEFCSRNQELKVLQLANFKPRCESNYDEEIEEFKQKLEDSYQLCQQCQRHLTKTLNRVKTKFIGSKLAQFKSRMGNDLTHTAKIIANEGKVFTTLTLSVILILSIVNFMHEMKINLPTNETYSHIKALVLKLTEILATWIDEMKLSEWTKDVSIDHTATSALILNLILVINDAKKIQMQIIFSMLLWSLKLIANELQLDEETEVTVKTGIACSLIFSTLIMLIRVARRSELPKVENTSFHKIPTETLDDSDNEYEVSDASSFYKSQASRTAYSPSILNGSIRTSRFNDSIKTVFNKTTIPIEILSNKSFSIAKEVTAAEQKQVQNDITRLKLSDNCDGSIFRTSTVADLNSSQNPFLLDKVRPPSPTPSHASFFSTSTRNQLVSPPRLHSPMVYTNEVSPSWVGGGYWTSPTKKFLESVQLKPVISRSSSQSSGLGTLGSEKNSRENSLAQEEVAPSLFSDSTFSRKTLFGRPHTATPSIFSDTTFSSQPKSHNFFNSHGNFSKYRDVNTFYK